MTHFRRSKNKGKKKTKLIFYLIVFFIFIFLLHRLTGPVVRAVKGFSSSVRDSFLSFERVELKVPKQIYPETRAEFDASKKFLSAKKCDEIKKRIMKSHGALKDIVISKNYITGTVTVGAVLHQVVAKADSSGKDLYISEDGKLMEEAFSEVPEQPFAIQIGTYVPAGFLGFLREVRGMSEDGSARVDKISCLPDGDCSVTVNGGIEAKIGKMTEYLPEKIKAFKAVMNEIQADRTASAEIDLTYFNNESGKVFVTKNQYAAKQAVGGFR